MKKSLDVEAVGFHRGVETNQAVTPVQNPRTWRHPKMSRGVDEVFSNTLTHDFSSKGLLHKHPVAIVLGDLIAMLKNQWHSRRGKSQQVVARMSTASTVLVMCLLAAAASGAQAFGSSSGRMAVNLKQARPVRERAGICRVEMSAISRRSALAVLIGGILSSSQAVSAKAKQQTGGTDLDIAKLKIGLKGLNDLLDNWDEQTTLCNFAEVGGSLLTPCHDFLEQRREAFTHHLPYLVKKSSSPCVPTGRALRLFLAHNRYASQLACH